MTKYRQIGTKYGVVTFDNNYHRTNGVIRDAVPDGVTVLEIYSDGCVINPETMEPLRQYNVEVELDDNANVLWHRPG